MDPAFKLSDPWVSSQLTLHDLLSHQSDLPDHAGDILEDLGFNQQQILIGINPHTQKPIYYGYGWNISENSKGETTLSHSGGFSLGVRTEKFI